MSFKQVVQEKFGIDEKREQIIAENEEKVTREAIVKLKQETEEHKIEQALHTLIRVTAGLNREFNRKVQVEIDVIRNKILEEKTYDEYRPAEQICSAKTIRVETSSLMHYAYCAGNPVLISFIRDLDSIGLNCNIFEDTDYKYWFAVRRILN